MKYFHINQFRAKSIPRGNLCAQRTVSEIKVYLGIYKFFTRKNIFLIPCTARIRKLNFSAPCNKKKKLLEKINKTMENAF